MQIFRTSLHVCSMKADLVFRLKVYKNTKEAYILLGRGKN